MDAILIYSIILGFTYLILISIFHVGWHRLPVYNKTTRTDYISVSVIIPCRNEEKRIPVLLKCLNAQNYPGKYYEVLVINDHSDDRTIEKTTSIENLHYSLKTFSLPPGIKGKKQAIQFGMKKTKNNLIITLDADIVVGCDWLSSIVSFYREYDPVMIICPVVLHNEKTSFEKMQSLEWLSLIGSGAGSASIRHPISCNGANLAFTKDNYYQSVAEDKFPSGDDMILMTNVKKSNTKKIFFLKSKTATAYTNPCSSLKRFINQRKRWASKSKYYRDADIIVTALVVLLLNLSLAVLLAGSLFIHQWLIPFILLFIFKLLADFPFLLSITCFFNKKHLIYYFLITELIYIIYIPYTAITGLLTSFSWKNRKYHP